MLQRKKKWCEKRKSFSVPSVQIWLSSFWKGKRETNKNKDCALAKSKNMHKYTAATPAYSF